MLLVRQLNLQHSRAATATLCAQFRAGGADLVLIQEPWLVQGRIAGLAQSKGKLIFDTSIGNSRACILMKPELNPLVISEFCSRDLVALRVKIHMGGRELDLVLASVYLPYDSPSPPPSHDLQRLVEYCEGHHLHLIMGADANSQNMVWGSSKTNQRGESLLEFILLNNLNVLNHGNEPTFVNRARQEVIDITMCSQNISSFVTKWYVSEEATFSDHRCICFEVDSVAPQIAEYRNPRRTNWEKYRHELSHSLEGLRPRIANVFDLEDVAGRLQGAIIAAYNDSCPLVERSRSGKVTWWTQELETLKKRSRRLFNKAKKTGNWDAYREALSEYSRLVRKTTRDSWRKFCSEVENTSEGARLNRVLAKSPTPAIGTLKTDSGEFTKSGDETLEVLLRTHFPDSIPIPVESAPILDPLSRGGAKKEDWDVAKLVFHPRPILWAINSFGAYKSPGPDGIYPALLQQGQDLLIPILCKLFKASLAMGRVPEAWRQVRVVFIPKPNKPSYAEAKSFRPISLSSFILKTMEKVLDRHMRSTALFQQPLHPFQHAYQQGKSCETAVHQLVHRIEEALEKKEVILGAFLDIEGAFDNTTFTSMVSAAKRQGVENTICRWLEHMLRGREVEASMCGATKKVSVARGTPQGGVLSPLMWNLVVNGLLVILNANGYYAQGYADDVVVLIRGKYTAVISELMQGAMKMVEEWCVAEDLSINPSKTTLVPFTKKKNLDGLTPPIIFNVQLEFSVEVKILGVILDSKLTWNQQLQKSVKKGKATLMAGRRAFGKTWGLKPRMLLWLYNAVVKPQVTYCALVWWPKVNQQTAIAALNSVQRLACLCMTGAMRSTPQAAMETLLDLPPLDLIIKGEARLGAYRLKCSNNWKPGNGHSRIDQIVTDPEGILLMGSDYMVPIFSFEESFQVDLTGHDKLRDDPCHPGCLMWYTDGSKSDHGTGAGVHGKSPRHDLRIPLGKLATVFQAEVTAINKCAEENLRRGYRGKHIEILSDSQAALKALTSNKIKSKLVWNCLNNLKTLANHNKLSLKWVPGHEGISGNERADQLAKKAAAEPFVGPEPVCGISRRAARRAVQQWIRKEHATRWENISEQRHSKLMLTSLNQRDHKDVLNLSRTDIRLVMGLMTGHCPAKKHLHTMRVLEEPPICRFCGEEDETATHLIFECEALERTRQAHLGFPTQDEGIGLLCEHPVRSILAFGKKLKL